MNPRRRFDLRASPCGVWESLCLTAKLCAFFASFSTTVMAQGVYKSIGPGGKVIYTDKPIRQPDGRLTPLDAVEYANSGAKFDSTTRWSDPSFNAKRSGDAAADAALDASRRAAVTAATEASKAAAQAYQSRVEASKNMPGMSSPTSALGAQVSGNAAVPAPGLGALSSTSSVKGKVEPVSSSSDSTGHAIRSAPDPKLERALVEVMATEHLVEQSIQVCSANQPADVNRLAGVLVKWRERNNVLLAKHLKLMSTSYSIAQLRDMEETATISNRTKLERSNAVVEDVRVKWCTQMMADIGKGSLDLAGKPEIAAALALTR